MSAFKPYPEVELVCDENSSAMRVMTKKGDPLIIDTNCDSDALQRFVDCWNACRQIAFPTAHIEASEDYIARLERLRKEAWARAEALQDEIDQLRSSKVAA